MILADALTGCGAPRPAPRLMSTGKALRAISATAHSDADIFLPERLDEGVRPSAYAIRTCGALEIDTKRARIIPVRFYFVADFS